MELIKIINHTNTKSGFMCYTAYNQRNIQTTLCLTDTVYNCHCIRPTLQTTDSTCTATAYNQNCVSYILYAVYILASLKVDAKLQRINCIFWN